MIICIIELMKEATRKRFGGKSEEEPPVPIPNTEVKLFSADGTWRETARESRTLPEQRETVGEIRQSFFM